MKTKNAFMIIALLCICANLFGQRFKTSEIIRKADSLIITVVGQDVFREHFKLDTTSDFYNNNVMVNEETAKPLSVKKKSYKNFKFLSVSYIFFIRKPDEPSARTTIVFDKKLNLHFPVDTSFIPKFILQNTADNFLTKEDAINISASRFKKKGIKIESKLFYDFGQKQYVWEIINIIEEFSIDTKRIEYVKINPLNGEIIKYFIGGTAKCDTVLKSNKSIRK
jgi:hypothetical protein